MQNATVFRPKGNLIWGGIALFFDALFLTQAFFYPAPKSNIGIDAAAAVAVGTTAALLWIRPKLILREHDLVVVNPLRSTVIDYNDITELETKWALLIHHSTGKTRVWVAPANGKQRWVRDSTQRWSIDRLPTNHGNETEVTSISQSLNSDSGVAAHLIKERLSSRH
jgi:hypothetical protein